MLLVQAVNIFTDKEDVADYEVVVAINASPIWFGIVEGHQRSEGAEKLLHTIADQMKAERGLEKKHDVTR